MLRHKFIFICVLALTFSGQAKAQQSGDSLLQYYAQLQADQKKAEDSAQKAHNDKDALELKRELAEKDISARRQQIENMKAEQEKSRAELEQLSVSLQKVNGDLDSYKAQQRQVEESAASTLHQLESQRQDLNDKRLALESELHTLETGRAKAEHDVYLIAVDIERYKADIARTQTKIAESQAKKAALEADEVKIRGELEGVKTQIAEHHHAQETALNEIVEARKQYDAANHLLADAKVELAKAEKAHTDAVKRSQEEVAKYEHDIAAATKARLASESEQIRLDTEVLRLHEYSERIRALRDHNAELQANAESLELKSSLAVESAKSVHERSVENSNQTIYKRERDAQHTREVAAARNAPARDDSPGRLWVTSQGCKAFRDASEGNKAAAFFDSGKKLLAREHGADWVEIMNGSGASVFVQSKCGHFEK